MESNNAPATSGNNLDHKIIVILREDLEPWQRLNVAAFTVSGIAADLNLVGMAMRCERKTADKILKGSTFCADCRIPRFDFLERIPGSRTSPKRRRENG